MPVHIEELTVETTVVEPEGLLTPELLQQIVAAVVHEIEARARAEKSRATERDLRSTVERQRAKGRP